MAENRALAAVARQANITQNQLAQTLRREEGDKQRRNRGPPAPGGRGWLLPERGDDGGDEEAETAPLSAAALEGKVQMLAAALKRAEAARAREREAGEASLTALREGLGAVGTRAVEAARLQMQGFLDVVGALEQRLEEAEARAAAETQALRADMARLFALVAMDCGGSKEKEEEREEDGPLAAALELIETLEENEGDDKGAAAADTPEGEEDEGEEEWADVRALLLRGPQDGAQPSHRRRRLREGAATGDEAGGGGGAERICANPIRSHSLSPYPPTAMAGQPPPAQQQRPRPSSVSSRYHQRPAGKGAGASSTSTSTSTKGRQPTSFVEWLVRAGKEAGDDDRMLDQAAVRVVVKRGKKKLESH